MIRTLIIPILILAASVLGAAAAYAADYGGGKICTKEYMPVCAAHQVQCIKAPCYPVYQTYGNACEASNYDTTIIHQGACTDTETGPVKEPAPYTPPANCTAWFDGCNSCAKQANGGAVCTLMACTGATKPGYCTAYAPTTHPTPQPPVATSSESQPSPATTTPPTEQQPQIGFLHQIWNWFLHWFHR